MPALWLFHQATPCKSGASWLRCGKLLVFIVIKIPAPCRAAPGKPGGLRVNLWLQTFNLVETIIRLVLIHPFFRIFIFLKQKQIS
jgi:hypothetical protein